MAKRKKHAVPPQAATAARAPATQKQERKARQPSLKAYALLADQPASLAGLSLEDRAQVVVSAVRDETGNTVVISRVGDIVWNLWPFVETPNTRDNQKILDWSGIPEPYRDAIQNILYAYWKRGREGVKTPGVRSLRHTLNGIRILSRYAAALGLSALSDLQPLHLANFVHDQKAAGKAAASLTMTFSAVVLLYLFRAEHPGTLQFHPWPESSACDVAGHVGQKRGDARKEALTPLIPIDTSRALFLYAEGVLGRAESLLDARDRGERSAFRDREITGIRDACGYLIGVLTGMRQSELSSINVGAGRTEVKNGFTYHWITATEFKTKKGEVEYLMPSMGHRILQIMDRWSAPFRKRLAEQIKAMEQRTDPLTPKELQWLATARSNRNRLFLSNGSSGIRPLSDNQWGVALKDFARAAGVAWALAPHQMRRLYAYTFVRHRLGDLLFLKEQFKHSSIDMSQLYAANPLQDKALYDDILSELLRYKGKVISTWLEKDEPLAGGAGKKIMEMRAHDFPDRKALVLETSERVLMRSNGHAWCLAQDDGCGGSGIYEKGRCGGCSRGVIDSPFIPIWEEAYRHHKELLAVAQELGPGAVARVTKDLNQAAKILRDLGIDPEQGADDAQDDIAI